jgi:methyltransferase family protein
MISFQNSTSVLPRSPLIPENVYGHSKRLDWIVGHLQKDMTIIELGCGTGSMISIPLAVQGYQVVGIDMDHQSIDFGRELLDAHGLSASILRRQKMQDVGFMPDVLIASEVLEHLHDKELEKILIEIKNKLAHGGVLLVTVPNGYGWFEMESFLWFKTGVGWLLERTRIAATVEWIKSVLFRCGQGEPYPPSTLADSPHVQRFTYESIQRVLANHGFEVVSMTGSVLFAGPFSNLFLTGIVPVMKINCWLGQLIPRLAAGFYVACRPIGPSEKELSS